MIEVQYALLSRNPIKIVLLPIWSVRILRWSYIIAAEILRNVLFIEAMLTATRAKQRFFNAIDFLSQEVFMGLKDLAEGIIIQSLEDLWIDKEREESLDFFRGEGFSICTEAAGMDLYEQVRLFNLANSIISGSPKPPAKMRSTHRTRNILSYR